MVLDKKAVSGDAVAVDDEAVVGEVLVPAHALAVIGAPDPGVVDDRVVRVNAQVDVGAAHAGAAHPEENIVQRDGILGVIGVAAFRTDFSEDGGFGFARVNEEAGKDDAVGVGGGDGGGAVDGLERGKAETEDDGVGAT